MLDYLRVSLEGYPCPILVSVLTAAVATTVATTVAPTVTPTVATTVVDNAEGNDVAMGPERRLRPTNAGVCSTSTEVQAATPEAKSIVSGGSARYLK